MARARRRRLLLPAVLVLGGLAAAAVGGALLLAGDGDPPPSSTVTTAAPPTTVGAAAISADVFAVAAEYLDAWERFDYAAMRDLVVDPPRDFASRHVTWTANLEVDSAAFVPFPPDVDGDAATLPVAVRLTLRGLGDWAYDSELALVRAADEWRVAWSPSAIYPGLPDTFTLERTRVWPDRATIQDHTGEVLRGPRPVVAIGIQPNRVDDRAVLFAALEEHLGVLPEDAAAILDAPGVQPNWFLPVTELTEAEFEPLREVLQPVAGLVFRTDDRRLPPRPGFAHHVLGWVGEITVELIERLGTPYTRGDVVGRNGLEFIREQQLAGAPWGDITLYAPDARLLHSFPGERPQPLLTTLDITVQDAVERALDGADLVVEPEDEDDEEIVLPAALVVVDVATGEIRGAASRPLDGFNRAFDGLYPPGSTFKIVTAAAALAAGRMPEDIVECPPDITVAGRTFRNASSVGAGSISFTEAFARSCNTAFIGLAVELEAEQLAAAASHFGFDAGYDIPLPWSGGRFPAPGDPVEQAAAAIGQARVQVSPLHMASVAAAVASGSWNAPRLLRETAPSPARVIDPEIAEVLRAMMRAVVTGGTGTAADVAGEPVHGKTGSAEFGEDDEEGEKKTHAWFVGYRGDLAFAVMVEGGGSGGGMAAPIAAGFLETYDELVAATEVATED